MTPMYAPVQVAIRFVLELAAVIAAGIVGASIGSPPLGLIGAIVLVAAFAVVWGLFLAPRARFPQRPMVRLVAGTLVMELAAVGYAVVGPTTAGVILSVVILANAVALFALGADVADEVFSR